MENIKYNKKSRTDISRSVPWPRAKTMPLDEPAKMIMNRFSIIENYLICNDKQWTNFSIGFLRLKGDSHDLMQSLIEVAVSMHAGKAG